MTRKSGSGGGRHKSTVAANQRRSALGRTDVGRAPSRAASVARDAAAPSTVWQIEKLIPGGDGLARLDDGRIGFASGVLPGERLAIEQSEGKKNFVRALRFRVLEASPERVVPPCIYAHACGGCDWLHIDYGAQLRHKVGLLRDALTRTAKLERLPELSIEASPDALGYRDRIRIHLERGKIGFRARGSHELVDIASCRVALPELDRCFARFRQIVESHAQSFELFSEAELRVVPVVQPDAGDELGTESRSALVRLIPREPGARVRQQASALLGALAPHFAIAIAGEENALVQRFALDSSLALTVPAEAFVQVNWQVNRSLVAALVREAVQRGLTSFVDLYAGAGNFTLPLLAAGLSGVAVEGVGAAAEAARRSIDERGFSGEVLASGVTAGIESLRRAGRRFELVVLDPPRAGAAEVLTSLTSLGARCVAYCACDPVTLARDLRQLMASGFELESVRAYDMFPGTHHFESVAWLSWRR